MELVHQSGTLHRAPGPDQHQHKAKRCYSELNENIIRIAAAAARNRPQPWTILFNIEGTHLDSHYNARPKEKQRIKLFSCHYIIRFMYL